MPHAIPDMHLLLGAMVASGASLRWFRDTLAGEEVAIARQQKRDAFDLLTEQAGQIKPGSDGVIFLPYMMGERAPIWHTQARGVFFGLTLATSKGAMVRAVLEGTAFALRHNLEVARNAGVPVQEIRSVGGGTRSALWNQIKADVTGFPVLLPETSVGAPFGDALLAGMGLNWYTDIRETAAKLIRVKTVYEPERETHERYQAMYAIFRRIYEHLREDFDAAALNL
jgi:xylulokinase